MGKDTRIPAKATIYNEIYTTKRILNLQIIVSRISDLVECSLTLLKDNDQL